ncbi:MAG: aldehyde dehydrogenase (NADP(+)) [Akkermansiaceae bacterium]|nr:aldehyde dehydrogenase (NADP(+)) [Akkermansiaceae bacterium]
MTTELLGKSIIGWSRSEGSKISSQGVQPGTGAQLEPGYCAATDEEVQKALQLASSAFGEYSKRSGKERAEFLRKIAEGIDAVVEDIVERGQLETALPEPRLRGETARTTGQLRLFASLIEEGSWVDARIERAQPDREPLPKPDIRSMHCPLGPVAVFCASNFPLAFSVAGGDTASALAAGCPVVVIAHSSHPGVAEIVGTALQKAAQLCKMPEGVFSLLYGGGRTVGQAVVSNPAIQAVGFTGSRAGGTALMATANQREQPIPVYAEMSSINPVVLLSGGLAKGEEALAEGFYGSLTLGVGQFCTNPGLVFLEEGSGEGFLAKLKELIEAGSGAPMLNSGICRSYKDSTQEMADHEGVDTLAVCSAAAGKDEAVPVAFTVSAEDFLADPDKFQSEMFGPATLIVKGSIEKITEAISKLEGQLTASLHGTEDEVAANAALVAALQNRAGRLVFNGFPTGVEVCSSMVHGGPYPATSDGRSTSVGTMAIQRFVRPIAWQDFPDAALPAELQDGNPLGIQRSEA